MHRLHALVRIRGLGTAVKSTLTLFELLTLYRSLISQALPRLYIL